MSANTTTIADVYEKVKHTIAYDSFTTIMIALVLFLTLQKIYDEWNKLLNEGGTSMTKFSVIWGHVRIYIILCVVVSFSSQIFSLVESILSELQDLLVSGFGGENAATASDSILKTMEKMYNDYDENSLSNDGLSSLVTGALTGGVGVVFPILIHALSWIAATIGMLIFKWTYTVFLVQRYMWLLMLELIAPIAIVLVIHDNTRSYFYSWVKNMIICYLLIPMYLLADIFSNEIAFFLTSQTATGSVDILCTIMLVMIIKLKCFATVKQYKTQLF